MTLDEVVPHPQYRMTQCRTVSTETRILATDPRTRRFFAVYWFLIRASSAAIRREVLRVVARRAESPRATGRTTMSAQFESGPRNADENHLHIKHVRSSPRHHRRSRRARST